MNKSTGDFPKRLRETMGSYSIMEFAKMINYSIRMVEGWLRGEFPITERAARRISYRFYCDYNWLMYGKFRQIKEDYKGQHDVQDLQDMPDDLDYDPIRKMVASGSAEEAELGADVEDFELPLECFRDKDLLARWVNEESACYLYRLTRAEVKELADINIHDYEGWEDDYSAIYRSRIVAMRQLRHELAKKLKQQKKAPPEKKAAEG